MRHRFTIWLVLLVLLAAVGCQKANKFVGTWKMDYQGNPSTLTLKQDGTMAMDVDLPSMHDIHVRATGTWKASGDDLTMTVQDGHATNLPDQLKGQEEAFDKGLKQGMEVGKEKTNKVTWVDDNTFTANTSNGERKFTRAK